MESMDHDPAQLLTLSVVQIRHAVEANTLPAAVAKDILSTRFDNLLAHFRLRPSSNFRKLLRKSNAVIAGYPTIQFVVGMDPSRAPLDIYIGCQDYQEVRIYLLQVCGYVADSSSTAKDVTSANEKIGIETTTRLIHYDFASATARKINLLTVTAGLHHARAIAFGGTTAMSYLTADAVHVFSPEMTCNKRALVLMHDSFGTPWNSLGFENPYHLVGPTGNLIRRMMRDGFDVRYPRIRAALGAAGAACGFACPAKAAAEGEDLPQTWIFGEAEGDGDAGSRDMLLARYAQFLVSGVCTNPACPNYV